MPRLSTASHSGSPIFVLKKRRIRRCHGGHNGRRIKTRHLVNWTPADAAYALFLYRFVFPSSFLWGRFFPKVCLLFIVEQRKRINRGGSGPSQIRQVTRNRLSLDRVPGSGRSNEYGKQPVLYVKNVRFFFQFCFFLFSHYHCPNEASRMSLQIRYRRRGTTLYFI